MAELVHSNLEEAQRRQKQQYDQKARKRSFAPGDQVLILLAIATSQLLAQWQGPYSIVSKGGPVTYKVDMHDKRVKQFRIVHVNMHYKWHTPGADCFVSEVVTKAQLEEDSGSKAHQSDEPFLSLNTTCQIY